MRQNCALKVKLPELDASCPEHEQSIKPHELTILTRNGVALDIPSLSIVPIPCPLVAPAILANQKTQGLTVRTSRRYIHESILTFSTECPTILIPCHKMEPDLNVSPSPSSHLQLAAEAHVTQLHLTHHHVAQRHHDCFNTKWSFMT